MNDLISDNKEIYIIVGDAFKLPAIFFCPGTKGQRDVPSRGNPNPNQSGTDWMGWLADFF